MKITDDGTLRGLKLKARERPGYARRDRRLAEKITMTLGYSWDKVQAAYSPDGCVPDEYLRDSPPADGLTRTHDIIHCDSYLSAMNRVYPYGPIELENTGLDLWESDFDPRKLLAGFARTRACRAFHEFLQRTWYAHRCADDARVVGCIFRTVRGSREDGVVIHNLQARRLDAGATHLIQHWLPQLSGRVYVQSFPHFLDTLANVAPPTVEGDTPFGTLQRWLLERIANGDHIANLTVDHGGTAIGTVHRGKLLLAPEVLPPEMSNVQFRRSLAADCVIEGRDTRGTYLRQRRIDGYSHEYLEISDNKSFDTVRRALEAAGVSMVVPSARRQWRG